MDTTLRTAQRALQGGDVADRGVVARRWLPWWSGRLLLTMGVAALLVACGGDPVPAGIPDPSVPDALSGTPPEVEEALLTTEDLGEGWTDLGAVPLGERSFAECPETGVVTDGEDPARLGEAQSHYGEGDPPVPTFGVSVSLWESPDVARERLATLASIPSECGSFEQELPEGGTATVTITDRDAPPLGEEAVAQVIEVDLPEGPTILRDVVTVRIGDALVLTDGLNVAEGDPKLDRQRERFDDLAGRAVDKASRILSD
jgi:hypothetical protein